MEFLLMLSAINTFTKPKDFGSFGGRKGEHLCKKGTVSVGIASTATHKKHYDNKKIE